MLPVIFSNPGIVSDFERLSDKALKPSLAGEWPGCKMVFSNSLLNCSCFLFQLTISCLSFTVPLFTSLFFLCVNSSKPNYGFFSRPHSLVFALKIQKHLCSSCLYTYLSLSQHHCKSLILNVSQGTLRDDLTSLLKDF